MVGVLLGFLVALPFAIGLTLYEGESFSQITAKGWMAVTYVGLFEMGITFVLWLSALKLTNNTARISNLIFCLTVYLANATFDHYWRRDSPATLFGLMLIIAGLVIQQIKWGKKKTTSALKVDAQKD